MSQLKTMLVIPARIGSSRLARKMLLSQTGKPLIQHTYESASRAKRISSIVVATDHKEIFDAVVRFGGVAVMTDPNCKNGTERVAEVATARSDYDLLVNVQGDEPEISATSIDLAISLLEQDAHQLPMSTLATPIRDKNRLHDPNCVKVVLNADDEAIYFSRSPIPYPCEWNDGMLDNEPPVWLQHVGLYCYRREFLLEIARRPSVLLEHTERLEQLRVLHAGQRIKVGIIDEPAIGIDTQADYEAFVKRVGHSNG